MAVSRRLTTAGGALLCALGVLYFQSQGDAAPSVQAALPAAFAAPVQPKRLLAMDPVTVPTAQQAAPPASAAIRPLPAVALPDRSLAAAEEVSATRACPVSARSTVLPMATVRLMIDAPCQGAQTATVHHNRLMVTEVTNARGQLVMDVPALSDNAVFIVDFPDGAGTVALAKVPALHRVERFALQWTGPGQFRLHTPADAGPDGRPQAVLTRLGDRHADAARLAEIYTRPVGAGPLPPLDMIVEAEVTGLTCGREVSAQSIEWRRGARLRSREMVLSMPACSAIGDFLVLNNLTDDLMIASR